MRNESKFNIEFSELFYTIKNLHEEGCVFQYFDDLIYDGRKITIGNKELLHFANCSYLGLEKYPSLIKGAIDAVQQYGTQNSMSRAMLSSPLYKKLENYLSIVFPGHQAVYPTTTLTHCSALPLLIQKDDAIILDAYVHNSVRMASQLCSANGTFVVMSKHNDMDHVKYLTYRLKKEGYKNIWYCCDGLYSIHGNFCDVAGLQQLLNEQKDLYAYIDDAHSVGWYGKNGSGFVIGKHGLHEKMIVVVSFAKSMAASGAALISMDKDIVNYLKFTGQTMIFSGPILPSVLGAIIASFELHLSSSIISMQNELKELIRHFRNKSKEFGLPITTKDETPIQLLRIGNANDTNKILKKLLEKGFFAMTASYPAIEKGEEGIRITITRHLSKNDISNFLEYLKYLLFQVMSRN